MVEDLASSPESSVPLASRDAAALQGAYDFWSNPRVKAEGILSGHVQSTVDRCDGRKVVLAIQDTTELNYSGHRSKRGLGYLRGEETRGALLHSVLAASADGVPLGILHQKMWARQGRKTKQRRRPIEEKESVRWLESQKRSEELLSEKTRVITVADREADIYELKKARAPGQFGLSHQEPSRPAGKKRWCEVVALVIRTFRGKPVGRLLQLESEA
jgi:hypothetical protein